MDRSWMDHRVVDGVISAEYNEDVKYFCDYAFENTALLSYIANLLKGTKHLKDIKYLNTYLASF